MWTQSAAVRSFFRCCFINHEQRNGVMFPIHYNIVKKKSQSPATGERLDALAGKLLAPSGNGSNHAHTNNSGHVAIPPLKPSGVASGKIIASNYSTSSTVNSGVLSSALLPVSEDALRSAIKKLLKGADLDDLSSKKVRKLLENKFKCDLSRWKQEVDDILMAIVNATEEESDSDSSSESSYGGGISRFHPPACSTATFANASNALACASNANSRRTNSGSADVIKPAAKKMKANNLPAEVDAEMQLQTDDDVHGEADEAKARALRPRKVPKKKKLKKATAGAARTRKDMVTVYVLSDELAAVLSEKKMPVKQVVKRMWQVFRERNLFDPRDGHYVLCDEELKTIFKIQRVKAFTMMTLLKKHKHLKKDVPDTLADRRIKAVVNRVVAGHGH